ncbi:hypothetical protein [Sinanaerobacter sp. ZZT-01]|uniref:hypothetical protein n=1 Tax=Sinanaerobacter sp. ZZT-01 TaxID=3111540 RepID=UPI002D77F7D1|nr:hypothetical protein [Sinanaerobacter sp. ZZT-01]WRR92364.1 hypothetical protein U5921_09845 [Sinanaerobacter sp. ZZT-01]
MKLSNLIKEVQIPTDHYILIEYDLFFNEDLGKFNKFSIDDPSDIKKLTLLINGLKTQDEAMKLYVLSYSYETVDYKGNESIYADCLWLDTTTGIDAMDKMFEAYKSIQPSGMSHLKEMEEYNQEHFYLLNSMGAVIDLKRTHSAEHDFENVKILYWD